MDQEVCRAVEEECIPLTATTHAWRWSPRAAELTEQQLLSVLPDDDVTFFASVLSSLPSVTYVI